MASYYKPSPFQHADADSKSTYRLLPSTLKAQEGNAVQQCPLVHACWKLLLHGALKVSMPINGARCSCSCR
eukprot:1138840-Pelagomonas_calceolata.AAC.2